MIIIIICEFFKSGHELYAHVQRESMEYYGADAKTVLLK